MNGADRPLGTEGTEMETRDKYYPLGPALTTLLTSLDYSVSFRNGLATISYGFRSITIEKDGDIWREKGTAKTFTFRSGIAIYVQKLKD